MPLPWFNFVVAVGLGLLIGLERERNKGEGPTRGAAGIRTFALAALVGALSIHVGGVALLVMATGIVGLFTALSYRRESDADPGLTTEVALLATPLLGAMAMSDATLASGLGVGVASLLAAKAPVHRFVKGTLGDTEVTDGLVFAIATIVIWPQLPDRYIGPYNALNPHTLWLLVVMMLAIGAGGHIAMRLLGPVYGLPISGLASGFVSSTATIGAMAGRAKAEPAELNAAVAGAALSTVATFAQMALLLGVISWPTLVAVAPALAAGGLVAMGYGGAFTLKVLKSERPPGREAGRAFGLATVAILVATMAFMLVAAAGLKDVLGEVGIVIGAIVAGFADTHSAAISIASLTASSKLASQDAVVPILAAMTSNVAAKIAMAIGGGSSGFAKRVVPGLVLSIAAAWGVVAGSGFG